MLKLRPNDQNEEKNNSRKISTGDSDIGLYQSRTMFKKVEKKKDTFNKDMKSTFDKIKWKFWN